MAQLPDAVQRQIEEAERLEAGISEAPVEDSPKPEEQADSPEAPQEETPDPKDERISELERELQSARVEQGRVKTLNQQLRTAQEQIEQLQSEIETLKTQEPQAPVSSAKRDELVDSYGEDLVSYMEEVANTQAAKLQGEIDRIKGDTGEVKQAQAASQQERFWSSLNAAHPDWQKIQATKEGQDFLLSSVPYDMQGRTFDDLLQEAAKSYNAQAAIDVFGGMKRHIEANKKASPQDRAKSQVVPGKGPGGTPPTQNTKPTFTQREVHQASLEYAKNQSLDIPQKYGAKTIEEWDEMVNLAALEGRLK